VALPEEMHSTHGRGHGRAHVHFREIFYELLEIDIAGAPLRITIDNGGTVPTAGFTRVAALLRGRGAIGSRLGVER
jgi:hypothetical protein